ncbi:hypothetical protein E1211_04965 [Micromonospora sp. 15K316]|nr:hypothetical protein E1211_04965 [Micromonospora sp. 15K316]
MSRPRVAFLSPSPGPCRAPRPPSSPTGDRGGPLPSPGRVPRPRPRAGLRPVRTATPGAPGAAYVTPPVARLPRPVTAR